jgi:hypothetical protein
MALNLIPGREAKWQVGAAIIFASHRAQLVTAIEVVLENFQGGSAWRTLAMNMSNLLEEERGDGSEGRRRGWRRLTSATLGVAALITVVRERSRFKRHLRDAQEPDVPLRQAPT